MTITSSCMGASAVAVAAAAATAAASLTAAATVIAAAAEPAAAAAAERLYNVFGHYLRRVREEWWSENLVDLLFLKKKQID